MDNQVAVYFLDQLRAYSPSGRETVMASVIKKQLKEVGYSDVRADPTGNIGGRLRGAGKSVLIFGHMDTVPGRLPVSFSDGIFRGRGAVDAKASLLSLMLGSAEAKDAGSELNITFFSVVDEEGKNMGIRSIINRGIKAEYAIFGEPSNTVDLTVGYRGRLLIEMTVTTAPHHASAPWQGINAIEKCVDLFREIAGFYGNGRNFRDISVSLTSISARDSHNVTPSRARCSIDLRYPPSRSEDSIMDEITRIVNSQTKEYWVGLRIINFVKPYVTNMKSKLANSFKTGIKEVTKNQPSMLFKSGSGDMNIMGNKCNIETLTYGPGDPGLSHTSIESVSLSDIEKSIKIIKNSLLNLESR